jgi:N-acyl-D-aspartate/D-glutamate deacylase
MALAANSPLNWNILVPRNADFTEGRLRSSDHGAARGARIVGLSYPDVIRARTSFLSAGFDSVPGWASTMALPPDAKIAALKDPARRAELRAGAKSGQERGMPASFYEGIIIAETFHPSNEAFAGRTVSDIAAELGRDPFDVLCDVVIADDLRTGLVPVPMAADDEAWAERVKTWSDPRVVIGASDAGAHLDMLTSFDYSVRFLALARDHEALSLEAAVHRLTEVPAQLYGLRDRGRLAPGLCADLVVFDEATVDTGPVEWRDDLPAGSGRLYAEPFGIAHVVVNGTEIVREGRSTGALPGKVLRGGHDTFDHPG